MRLHKIILALVVLGLSAITFGGGGVLGGSTHATIESEGPGTGHATLAVPPWPLVDVHIELRGDTTCSIQHAPTIGKGLATWLIGGRDDGGPLRALRARVVFLGLDLPETAPELFPSVQAAWNLASGGAMIAFDDFATHAPIILRDVPAWTRPLEVKADFETDYTNATLQPVNGTTSFELTQRAHVTVVEAASTVPPQP